jgi:hypothetical protein
MALFPTAVFVAALLVSATLLLATLFLATLLLATCLVATYLSLFLVQIVPVIRHISLNLENRATTTRILSKTELARATRLREQTVRSSSL